MNSNLLFEGDTIYSKGVKMQVRQVLDQGNDNFKANVSACKFNGSKPLKNRPQYIGNDWKRGE